MKIRLILIKITFLALISFTAGRAVYRFYIDKKPFGDQASPQIEAEIDHIKQTIQKGEQLSSHDTGSYNFGTMLALIQDAQRTKEATTTTFSRPTKSYSHINQEKLRFLIQRLQVEKRRLRNYMLDLNSYSRSGLSLKKIRTFHYYEHVLEEALMNMREIQRNSSTANYNDSTNKI